MQDINDEQDVLKNYTVNKHSGWHLDIKYKGIGILAVYKFHVSLRQLYNLYNENPYTWIGDFRIKMKKKLQLEIVYPARPKKF